MIVRKVDRPTDKTYYAVRNQDNWFLHVSGIQGRWTITPYDVTLFETEEDAQAYLNVAELGDYDTRIVPVRWTCEVKHDAHSTLSNAWLEAIRITRLDGTSFEDAKQIVAELFTLFGKPVV